MKLDWKSALGFALSALLLWWTLREVSPTEVWSVLRQSNVALFALSAIAATCIFPLRARRWRTILEPVAGTIAFGPLWRSTAIGMMMNNVFPFRAGEFGRAFALHREIPRVPMSTALGSLAVDRIFDAIVLLALMFGAMLDPAFPSGVRIAGQTVPQLAAGGMVGVVVLLGACYTVVLRPTLLPGLVRWVAHRVLPRVEEPLVAFVQNAVGGLAVLKDSRRFLAVLLWAVAHWLMHSLAFYLGFLAVGLDVPFSAALFLQGVIGIGVLIPSSPGSFGVLEWSATVGLAVYGVATNLATSWAIGFHLLSFIPITLFGAVYFTRLGLSVGTVTQAKESSPA